jgi:predicted transcriptional regulator
VVKAKDAVKRESYSVRLDPLLVTELKHIAVDEKKPVSMLIEEGIKMMLKTHKGYIEIQKSTKSNKKEDK